MLITTALVAACAAGHALGQAFARRTPGTEDRRRWLADHPGEARHGDVARLLRGAGLASREVYRVERGLELAGVKPFTAWMFAEAYGARALADAVRAGLTHDELLDGLTGSLGASEADAADLGSFEVPSDEPVLDWDFFEATDRDSA